MWSETCRLSSLTHVRTKFFKQQVTNALIERNSSARSAKSLFKKFHECPVEPNQNNVLKLRTGPVIKEMTDTVSRTRGNSTMENVSTKLKL